MFDDRYMTMMEGLLVTCGSCPAPAPQGFQPFGTVRLPGQRPAALFLSDDGQQATATCSLDEYEKVFALAACKWLQRRRAACENSPRHCAKRRGQPFPCPSVGGPIS